MANRLEDLMKLAQNQQSTSGVPNLAPPNQLQGLLQMIAGVAQNTANPNTERGQIFGGAGNAYLTGINNQNKQQFMQAVGQIAQSQADPIQKINSLISLKAQHGTDYGLGVDDIVKQFSQQSKNSQTAQPKDIVTGFDNGKPVVAGTLQPNQVYKPPSGSGSVNPEDVASIGDSIISGQQPPDLRGMYGKQFAVKAYLAKQGYDLTKATRDWTATTQYVKSLNQPQQLRLNQALDSVSQGIEPLRQLSQQLDTVGFVPANKLIINSNLSGIQLNPKGLNPDQVQIATKFVTQMNLMRDELAQGFSGGNSPTESAFRLADQVLNPFYGSKQLGASLDQVKFNLGVRLNAISNIGPRTVGGYVNQPNGGGGQQSGGNGGGNSQVLTATNPKTGQRIKSMDGGQTWQ